MTMKHEELLELADRLDLYANAGDFGRKPDATSIHRRAAKALRQCARATQEPSS